MSKENTMYKYLADNVPSDVHFVINKYDNYRKARNSSELEAQIRHFVRNYGANALNSLAEIHPDKELLQGVCKHCEIKDREINKLSFDNKLHSEFLNVTGAEKEQEEVVRRMTINTIIVSGFVLMGIALLIKK